MTWLRRQEDESREKPMDPSSRRLEKAREEGKVVKSTEVFVFVLLAAGILLMQITPFFIEDF